jgi:hypothetical protein
VKVHCDEGVAIHIAPDPCADVREDVGEALVGERIGQPLSREIVINSGADAVHLTEGKIAGRVIASARGPAWSETLACTDAPCAGTERPLDRP